MRTTLTLEDDVAVMLERTRESQNKTFKAVVNEALRLGLKLLESPRKSSAPYRIRPVSAGRCLVDDLDNVAEALVLAEGDGFR